MNGGEVRDKKIQAGRKPNLNHDRHGIYCGEQDYETMLEWKTVELGKLLSNSNFR